MLYYECRRLNGWGCPFGIETTRKHVLLNIHPGLNGWGCPFGIETHHECHFLIRAVG